MHANLILPRLWLGDYDSSQDLDFIKRNRITVIVNCTKDLPFLKLYGIFKYRVPVHDNLQPEEIQLMTQWLKKIVPIIDYHHQKGRCILVHCAAGIQRSAVVMLSYLCQYHFHDASEALTRLKAKRPVVFTPYMNFKDSFCQYFGPASCYRLQTNPYIQK